jgi:hypothetical protein
MKDWWKTERVIRSNIDKLNIYHKHNDTDYVTLVDMYHYCPYCQIMCVVKKGFFDCDHWVCVDCFIKIRPDNCIECSKPKQPLIQFLKCRSELSSIGQLINKIDDCSMCLKINKELKKGLFNCNHSFCVDCVFKYIKNTHCPLCRSS